MPDELVSQIDEVAKRLGVSRSAYIVLSMSQRIQSDLAIRSMPDLQILMNDIQSKLSNYNIAEILETKK